MRFADGFDRPDTIAFGLEAPQLAVVVGGVLLAWGVVRAPLPEALAGLLAALVAVVAGLLGAGRWAGRPLLTWAWIAARFWLSPRRGGGPLLAHATDDGSSAGGSGGIPDAGGDAAGGDPGRKPEDDEPAWARWLRDGGARGREVLKSKQGPLERRDEAPGSLPVEPEDPGAARPPAEAPAQTAVEMWLAALGEGRGTGAPRTTNDLRVPAASTAHPAPRPPQPSAAAEAAPPTLGTLFRRLVSRIRGGASIVRAAPALPGGAEPATARAVAVDPHLPRGRTVELDRAPLVLLPTPDATPEEQPEAEDDVPLAQPSTTDDAAPSLAHVIPLVTRRDDELDEELMLELSEGDTAAAVQERPTNVATPPPECHNRGGRGGERTPVFVGATRRITFFSLNGGSGRTTLATEVASLLAARGRHRTDPDGPARRLRVALLDVDLRSSTTAVRLGIARPTLWDYLLATDDDVDVHRYLVDHPSGLRALIGPPKPLSTTSAAVEPARIAEIVHQLERDGCHFIVFDVGSDLGAVSTWVLSQVHDIYVVITPTGSGLQDAYRTTEALRRLGLGHKLRYVVNRARGSVDVSEVMDDLNGRVVASIPYDHRLEDAENTHTIASLRGGPASDAIHRLARSIYPSLDGGRGRRGLWRRRAG